MKRFLKRLIAPLVLCAAGFLLAYGTQFLPAEPALIREAAEAVFFLVIVPLFAFFLIWAIWAGLRDFWITRVRGEALPSAEESRIRRVLCGAPGQFRGMRGGAKFGNILLRLLSWILRRRVCHVAVRERGRGSLLPYDPRGHRHGGGMRRHDRGRVSAHVRLSEPL